MSKRKILFIGYFLTLLVAVTFIHHDRSFALNPPAAPSNNHPDTSFNGETTYMITELCKTRSGCMPGKITGANIYVPKNISTPITITIVDGCHTWMDLPSGFSHTNFYIFSASGPIGNSSFWCGFGQVDLAITFTPTSSGGTYGNFNKFLFMADGIGTNNTDAGVYYYNHFRLRAEDPDVRIGITDLNLPCDTGIYPTYPNSCPSSGIGYSSFAQPRPGGVGTIGGYWDQHIDLQCEVNAYASIELYDLDTGSDGQNNYQQTNIRGMVEITEPNGTRTVIPSPQIPPWIDSEGFPLSALPGSGNDASIYIPTTTVPNPFVQSLIDQTNIKANTDANGRFKIKAGNKYSFIIRHMTRVNTLTIDTTFITDSGTSDCSAPPPTACTISNIVRFSDNSSNIRTGDRIKFDVNIKGGNGWTLGVNGPNWGNEYPRTNINNYLVGGWSYARGPAVTSGDQTFTVTDIAYADGVALNQPMIAPGTAQNGVVFNWGLVKPGVEWTPITCTGSFDVKAPAPAPACNVTISVVGGILPYAQPNDTISLKIRVKNNAGAGGAALAPASYPVTLSINGVGSQNYNNYGADIPPDSGVTFRDIEQLLPAILGVGDFNFSAYITQPDGVKVNCTGPTTIRVVTYPYTQFFQSDVIAGYGISSGTCSASGGATKGYIDTDRADNTKIVGSGAQMAIFAAGAVNGFRSAITQDGTGNSNPKKDVFANTTAVAGGLLYSPSYGGSFDYPLCAADTWSQDFTGMGLTPGSDIDINFNNSRKYTGPIRVFSGAASLNGYRRVMVQGDVLIGSNGNQPVYNLGGWGSVSNIPMTIIYATGNVYFASNVTQFDGIVISKGTVYTCIPNTMNVGQAKTFTDATTSLTNQTANYGIGRACNNSLTVNGAIVANKIKLWRTGGTLNRSTPGQNYTAALTSGAEMFRLPPEVFMAPRGNETGLNGTGGGVKKMDSLISLPPRY